MHEPIHGKRRTRRPRHGDALLVLRRTQFGHSHRSRCACTYAIVRAPRYFHQMGFCARGAGCFYLHGGPAWTSSATTPARPQAHVNNVIPSPYALLPSRLVAVLRNQSSQTLSQLHTNVHRRPVPCCLPLSAGPRPDSLAAGTFRCAFAAPRLHRMRSPPVALMSLQPNTCPYAPPPMADTGSGGLVCPRQHT